MAEPGLAALSPGINCSCTNFAALLVTTEAMITEAPKKESGAAMPGGGVMGGMGGPCQFRRRITIPISS
jgi:hypothetical protein